jgi:putative ABC transport system permease protein
MLDTLVSDVRQAFRGFARRPALSAFVVLPFAFGIGATTAMFSVVNATLFRSVPFSDPDRLVMLYVTRTAAPNPPAQLRWSYPKFDFLRGSASSFEQIAAFTRADVNLTGVGDPERVFAEIVSPSYADALRIRPIVGRMFLPEEDREPGARPVAVLSYGLWQRRFGGDPGAIGRTVAVNSVPLVIVGVFPPDFRGLSDRADLWIPSAMAPALTYADYLTTPQSFINVVARLKPEVSLQRAAAETEALGREIDRQFPSRSATAAVWGASVAPLDAARVDPAIRRSNLTLFGAVGCVLAIACVNIASLLLGRAATREREVAVRLALGASRARLLRQFLTEALLLSVAGGALGIAVAAWSADALARFGPSRIAAPQNDYAQLAEFAAPALDWRVAAFALLVSILTGTVCGALPALSGSRPDLNAALKGGSRGSRPESIRRLRGLPVLVVTEIALSVVLLYAAVLLVRGFQRIREIEPGFATESLITFWVNPPPSKYRPADGPAIVERILDRVSGVGGVAAASVSRCAPYMSTCARTTLFLEGEPTPPPGAAPVVGRHYVGPEHFRTLQIPLVRGRAFTPQDRAGRAPVVVVNQAAARRFWPGQDPIGKRVWFSSGAGFNSASSPAEIVGVVGDVRYWPVEQEPGPDFYTCYLQFTYPDTMVFVRTAGDAAALLPALREAVRSVDRDLPIYDVKTIRVLAGDALARPRYHAAVVGGFALLAVLLAGLGIYGVVAYSVSTRTREIGIRMAVGAEAGQVLRMVVAESLWLGAIGTALGIAGSWFASRLLAGLLYGVQPGDPAALGFVVLSIAALSVAASAVPARRAARIEPVTALRHE